MNLRAFYRKYELELINASLESLTFGRCVWDGGWLDSPSFSHDGMPSYIYNTFVSKEIISNDESDAILDRFRTMPKIESSFSQENIELELKDVLDLKIKNQVDINASFDLKRVKSFSISNSVGKAMPNRDRIDIDKMLDQIKDNHWDEYKNGLRRAYIITELYYGKLEITIDTDLQIDFEASIPAAELSASNKLTLGKNLSYVFESSKVPFAMRIERIKHFNL